MGWTTTWRTPGITDRTFFESILLGPAPHHADIVACITKPAHGDYNNVFYAAIRNHDDAPRFPGITSCVVILMDNARVPGRNWNFAYRVLEEIDGPIEETCPDHILNLLSPTSNVHANDWRERCRRYNARLRNVHIANGQIVIFAQPVEFPGALGQHTRFRFRGTWWEAITADDQYLFVCDLGPEWFLREHELAQPQQDEKETQP